MTQKKTIRKIYGSNSSLSLFLFYLIVPAEKLCHCCARACNTDFYHLPISYSLSVYPAVDMLEVCSERHFVTGVFSSCRR